MAKILRKLILIIYVLLIMVSPYGCGTGGTNQTDSISGNYVNENNPKEYMTLYEDGTFYLKEGGYGFDGTWKVKDNDTIILTCMGMAAKGEIKGNKIYDEEGKVWVKVEENIEEVKTNIQTPENFKAWAEQAINWAKDREKYQDWGLEDLCLRFVANAFLQQKGVSAGWFTALEAFEALKTEELAKDDYNPQGWLEVPRGALIFFGPLPINGNYGHVGIYLGNSEVIHVPKNQAKTDSIAELVKNQNAYTYIGWGYPPEKWRPSSISNELSSLGGKILFQSGGDGYWDIYTMNADGTNQKRLTNNSVDDWQPAWSPDGSKIVFSSKRDGNYQLYIMNADGSNQKRITYNSWHDCSPVWSPDGSKIVFDSFRDNNWQIYIIDVDGSNEKQLTHNNTYDSSPNWSPDGSKIAFCSYRDGNSEIYIMDIDGANQKRLTNNNISDYSPTWSPDGNKTAFSSEKDGNLNIYVMNADGSNQIRLTNNNVTNIMPVWSPDGSKIAFSSFKDGNAEIYIMNTDGSNQIRLTNNPDYDYVSSWSK